MCVFIHDVADRREARSAKRNEKKTTEPHLANRLSRVLSVWSFCSSRSRTTYRLRRRGTKRKGTAGYPWSVSVSRAVQRGSGGARSSASEENKKTSRRSRLFPRRRRFRVCVTKEGLSAPDRSSEKSANAFLMSGAERRREKRVPGVARKTNTQKNANREGKRNPANASKRRSRLSSTARAAGVS